VTGARRATRGGSYDDEARHARSAYRNRNHPHNRNANQGFRLVRVSAPQPAVARHRDFAAPSRHFSAEARLRSRPPVLVGLGRASGWTPSGVACAL